MDIHILMTYAVVFTAGVSVSFINIMAGGGSVISLTIMMLLGIDATIANGTNRIGILSGSLSGALAYRSEQKGSIIHSLKFGFWAIPGALAGAWLAVHVDDVLFQRIFGAVILFVILTLFIPKPQAGEIPELSGWKKYIIHPILFLTGFYGGFVQAGVGFIIMASLRHLANMKLLQINIFKNHIVLLYTFPILVIFGWSGKIDWDIAAVLGAGNILGAWLSVKLSIRKGDRIIKYALAAAMFIAAVNFLKNF